MVASPQNHQKTIVWLPPTIVFNGDGTPENHRNFSVVAKTGFKSGLNCCCKSGNGALKKSNITFPSLEKKITIAEVYTWQCQTCFQLLLLFGVATCELVFNY